MFWLRDMVMLFASPLAGAVIGYFTNWLAIRMLFRPHKEKRIGGWKIPFTPGLIPKEKGRIAEKLGTTVAGHLITENAFLESLTSKDFLQEMEHWMEENFEKQKESKETVGEFLKRFLEEDTEEIEKQGTDFIVHSISTLFQSQIVQTELTNLLFEHLQCFLKREIASFPLEQYKEIIQDTVSPFIGILTESGALKQPLEKTIWNWMMNLKEDERHLEELIPYSNIQAVKDYLSVKTPVIAKNLLDLAEEPDTEEKLKKKLEEISGKFLGGFMRMLINTDSLYEKAIHELRVYFENPENQSEIDETVSIIVDKAVTMTVGELAEILTGEMREFTINQLVGAILHAILDEKNLDGIFERCFKWIEEKENQRWKDYLADRMPDYEMQCYSFLKKSVNLFCSEKGVEWIKKSGGQIKKQILSMPIGGLFSGISRKTFCQGKEFLLLLYCRQINRMGSGILRGINIPKMVENQINQMSMEETEQIIFAIASRELHAITLVGGILGFLIGFVPVLFQLL